MRVWATQAWPLFIQAAGTMPATEAATSASGRTTAADLPPSSSVTRVRLRAATSITRLPAGTEPVKETLSTPGWPTRYSLTSRSAGRIDRTPSGRPASLAISPSRYASSGDSGDGFSTTVQPASSAGASLAAATNCGTFQGTTAATTPTGSRRTRIGPSTPSLRSSYG